MEKSVFRQETGTRSAIHITMITTWALNRKDILLSHNPKSRSTIYFSRYREAL